jgi:glutaredoxin
MGTVVGGSFVTRRILLMLLAVLLVACGNKKKDPAGPDVPSLVLRDDSQGLLLTWIDDKGEFHVETRPKDVPLLGRDAVRLVDPAKDEGTHDGRVFVADMRTPKPDGTYPVKTMTKAEFDQIAVARRQKHGPTLADVPDTGPPPVQQGGNDPPPSTANANRTAVIIYGAPWCGPCHEAAAYLRKKGITYVEKDVEADPAAQKEMKSKLRGAGIPSGSIPVIDVRGKILVGFNPHAIDEALGRAT